MAGLEQKPAKEFLAGVRGIAGGLQPAGGSGS
jgi:hypothetical protein